MRALLLLIICAIFYVKGESVVCYNCAETSEKDLILGFNNCTLPFSPNDKNKKCTVDGLCLKGVAAVDGRTITIRECVPVTGNIKKTSTIKSGRIFNTTLCDTDFCNSASSATISLAAVFITIVFLL